MGSSPVPVVWYRLGPDARAIPGGQKGESKWMDSVLGVGPDRLIERVDVGALRSRRW